MIQYYCVNGEFVRKEDAVLHVSDLATLRGYGIFDYFQVRNGQPIFFDDYLDRFYRSADLLDLTIPFKRPELKEKIFTLLQKNNLRETAIRLVLTGGYSPDNYAPAAEANLLILQHNFVAYDPSVYEQGVKIITHQFVREFPEVKTTNYATGIKLLQRMHAAGAIEVLYHDGTFIAETTRANFFIVTPAGVLVTPKEGILRGITRKNTLKVAQGLLPIEERPLRLSELQTASEAFVTSSTKRVLGVHHIDELQIGKGKVGPITRELRRRLIAAEEVSVGLAVQA